MNGGDYGRYRRVPSHHNGQVLSTRSRTNSFSSTTPTDNPYIHSFQQKATVDVCRSPAVVRRKDLRTAPTMERQKAHREEDLDIYSLRTKKLHQHQGAELSGEGGSGTFAMEPTVVAELKRLLRAERVMRLAAERRTLEEAEQGARTAITIEANYGSRFLYSIFLENITSISATRTNMMPLARTGESQSPFSVSALHGKSFLSAPGAFTTVSDAKTYRRLMEENRQLREEVRRYKTIDTEDRREINELHRNMRMVIERLTLERDMLHAELTGGSSWHNAAPSGTPEYGRILPTTTADRSLWHYAHVVDPTAVNGEEPPEYASRLRVLPLS
ncbi:hypothetical protein MOQ_007583 [Trypanosoma cruzi marinkellei]|uniref:Uncharacterized protein n=1 Tax=Trypanosoma cruzi marinkellei TaxID=85056 RepID=K2M164_TRYCR|nr:hypothetical protein MOQ_007583 [Trypanosoma cruzi marinkellei]